jgi:ubiquinone/menaquinone biosynthesis C-methylase UbiE
MELITAIHLIKGGVEAGEVPQAWAELGAGEGLFTRALSSQLPPKSRVYAFDRDETSLDQIKVSDGIALDTLHLDFVKQSIDLPPLDGILMANALHYVKDQQPFLERLRAYVKPGGRLMVVEYDIDTPNTWVPYPLSYVSLQKLARRSGMAQITRLASAPSKYQGSMYSALILF